MFLLDQNLSPRLEKLLSMGGVTCSQVRSIDLENASDLDIWLYAKTHHLTINTSDSDFSDLAIVKGVPPRIILLRYGNTSTEGHRDKILKHLNQIKTFINSTKPPERVFVFR